MINDNEYVVYNYYDEDLPKKLLSHFLTSKKIVCIKKDDKNLYVTYDSFLDYLNKKKNNFIIGEDEIVEVDDKLDITIERWNALYKLNDKIIKFKQANLLYPFKLSDFGLRRRYSGEWQEHVVKTFAEQCPEFFVGTSNVYLAKMLGIKPIGTFAHEWYGGIQGESVRVSDVQRVALDTWAKEYRGELGIALSDNFGFRAFLRDFDKYFAKLSEIFLFRFS